MKGWLKRASLVALALIWMLGLFALPGCARESQPDPEAEAYANAQALMARGAYDAAAQAFLALNGYNDAALRGRECLSLAEQRANEQIYGQAAALQAEGDPAAARELFQSVPGYRDADERAAQCLETLQAAELSAVLEELRALPQAEDARSALAPIYDRLAALGAYQSADVPAEILRCLIQGDYVSAGECALAAAGEQEPLLSGPWWAELMASLIKDVPPMEAVQVLAGRRLLRRESYTQAASYIHAGPEDALAIYLPEYELPACGSSSGSKALCIVRKDNYYRDDTAYIDGAFMQLLPGDMQPSAFEEVRYLVTVDYAYKKIKKFTTYYTQGIREYALIRVMDTQSGRYVFKETVNGPTSIRAQDAVMASDVISCGPPDEQKVAQAMLNALIFLSGGNDGRIRYLHADGGAYLLSGGADEVPAQVNGLPVVGLNAGFLAGKKAEALSQLTLPASLQYIPPEAFCRLPALTRVTVPASVVWIGDNAFPPGSTIVGEPLSAAERYAMENGLPFEAAS